MRVLGPGALRQRERERAKAGALAILYAKTPMPVAPNGRAGQLRLAKLTRKQDRRASIAADLKAWRATYPPPRPKRPKPPRNTDPIRHLHSCARTMHAIRSAIGARP